MFQGNKNKIRTVPRHLSAKNRSNIFDRILYWLCFLAFLAGTIYVLFFSPWMMISEVNVFGAEDLNADSIKDFVNTEISEKYLNLLEKRNYLLVNQKRIEASLAKNFQKIEKVKVEKKFPNKLNISIEERTEVLTLCNLGQCFIVDDQGIAYAQIDPENSGEISEHLLILKNENGREIKLGDFVFAPDFAQYLLDIKYQMENNLGIKIEKEILIPQLISGDLRVKTQEGWMVYFDKNIPIEKEIKMLDIVLRDKLKDVKHEDIEYIDLRTDNKIYYKLKTQNLTENKPETQESPVKDVKDKKRN